MKKVTILDYKLGNIASIVNMLNFFPNLEINVSHDPKVILNSDKLILPGVGSFGDAMIKVNNLNIGRILDNTEIWEVFKDFFKKREKV